MRPLILLLLLLPATALAQWEPRFIVGVDLAEYPYLVFGAGYADARTREAFDSGLRGISLNIGGGMEEPRLMMVQSSVWYTISIMTAGGSASLYTDFTSTNVRLMPEIGIGLFGLRFTYGYSIGVSESELKGTNRHQVGIRAYTH